MNIDLTFLQGQHVTCALSGGVDSVVLLHLLHKASGELGITLSAAHYHHGLRQSADRDEVFVRTLCQRLQIPLAVGRGDAAAFAKEKGLSVEEGARQLRYGFLLEQPGLIATAHHADDQVETVLLNLLRGTGLKGLCAMERQKDRVVRPLLSVTRAEIEAYAGENGLDYCTDETNLQDDALRNRLRHHVIPLLQAENPNLAHTVGRMTVLLQQDEAFLSRQTQQLLKEAERDGGYDCRVLRASPLCARAIRSLLRICKPSACHVAAVEQLMEHLQGSARAELPGMTVIREYGIIYFGERPRPQPPQPLTVSLAKAGSLDWGCWHIAWSAQEGELTVRTRQTGDTLRLPGGTKSVKKLLIDKKVPAARRPLIPVVCRGEEVLAVGTLAVTADWIKIEERKQ